MKAFPRYYLPVFGHAPLSLPPGELERLRLVMASTASLASVLTKSRTLSSVRVGSCHFRIAVAAAALVLVVVTVVLLVVASAPHVEAVHPVGQHLLLAQVAGLPLSAAAVPLAEVLIIAPLVPLAGAATRMVTILMLVHISTASFTANLGLARPLRLNLSR